MNVLTLSPCRLSNAAVLLVYFGGFCLDHMQNRKFYSHLSDATRELPNAVNEYQDKLMLLTADNDEDEDLERRRISLLRRDITICCVMILFYTQRRIKRSKLMPTGIK